MNLLTDALNDPSLSTFYRGYWMPHHKEKKALKLRSHFADLRRIDHIWEWLANSYGHVTAVDAPHAEHPESFTYAQLCRLIKNSASAFRSFGIEEGDSRSHNNK